LAGSPQYVTGNENPKRRNEIQIIMILIEQLTTDDVGRNVIYTPYKSAKKRIGKIVSHKGKYILVDFRNTGKGQLTAAEKLEFETI
jgi:hypothetical protein